jgi:hypothetical protein
MLERWCSPSGVEFENAEAEASFKGRTRRVADAVQLKTPDRVPITPAFGMFPALDNGITCEDAFFDPREAYAAWMKTLADFEPDTYRVPIRQGSIWETIDCKQIMLPGRGISPHHNMQYVEAEYATADDFYDSFLEDPTDFILRFYLPRICGIFEPLKNLPPVREAFCYYSGLPGLFQAFGHPEISRAFEKLRETGEEMFKGAKFSREKSVEVMSMGFPADLGGRSHAPFDVVGDFIRGTRGIMTDMYRSPDKLLAAMEKLVPILIDMGLRAKKTGNPFVNIFLHKGADGFMSIEQYKIFYWPTLRKVMVGLIDEGLVPVPFFEGDNTSRLEIIKDIPKAKAVYWFEGVDIYKAKEILGGTVCFRGNVPVSLLSTGTPEQVRSYVKELIDVVGKGGGLMVDCGSIIDEAKHENVKAMIEYTKEYGVYE